MACKELDLAGQLWTLSWARSMGWVSNCKRTLLLKYWDRQFNFY